MSDEMFQNGTPTLPPPALPSLPPLFPPSVSSDVAALTGVGAPAQAPPSPPSLPLLPTLPPAVPAAPHVAPQTPLPTYVPPPAPSPRRRPASPWWHTVVRTFIVLALLAGLAAAGLFVVRGYRAHSALPEFPGSTRPEYGTAVLAMDGVFDGEAMRVTMTTGATADEWHVEGTMGGDAVEFWHDGSDVWVRVDGGPVFAVPANTGDAASYADAIGYLGQVYVFDDIVPPGSEDYFDIVERDDAEVDGRELDRISFVVAARRFRTERPAAYSSWFAAESPRDVGPELVGFTVDVDDDGLVWRIETVEQPAGERAVIALQSLSPEPFVVDLPVADLDAAAATGSAAAPVAPATSLPPLPAPVGGESGCWDSLFCGGEMPAGAEPAFPVTVPPAIQIIDSELPEPIPPAGG